MTRDRLVSVFVVLTVVTVGVVVAWLVWFRPVRSSNTVLVEPTTTPLRDSIREPRKAKARRGTSSRTGSSRGTSSRGTAAPQGSSGAPAKSPIRTGTNKRPVSKPKRRTPARKPTPAPSSPAPQQPPQSPSPQPGVTVPLPSVCLPPVKVGTC
jgi:hypothetical protein